MRFSDEEKKALFDLLDVMTDRCPQVKIDRLVNEGNQLLYWRMLKKLRLELKGF